MKDLQMIQDQCCSQDGEHKPVTDIHPDNDEKISEGSLPWITGSVKTPAGSIPRVTTEWSWRDRLGQIRSRISAYRMQYSIEPGLYAVGSPGEDSDVLVSANYKLSFDVLRRELKGISAWILVLDTKSINVWCAAGKGTFGTEELVQRIIGARLAMVVSHKRIIVPQLGATGVRASEVAQRTGFSVRFGPVYARDIKQYIEAGYKASQAMRRISFSMADRLVLTPMELNPAFKRYPIFFIAVMVIFGLQPQGIIFQTAWADGWPFLLLGIISILSGAFLSPLLLPFTPFRSFALKGWVVGTATIAPLIHLTNILGSSFSLTTAAAYILFPFLSSYLALQFTGSTTFTGITGVKKELRFALPIYIGGIAAALILIAIQKLINWGIL